MESLDSEEDLGFDLEEDIERSVPFDLEELLNDNSDRAQPDNFDGEDAAESEVKPLLAGEGQSSIAPGENPELRGDDEQLTSMTLTCFICIALSAFLGDASRGLVVPSIVPFLYQAGANSAFVGYVNGAYSAARLISAPLFGYWAERRSFKESVLINLVIFSCGNLMYSLSDTPLGSPMTILISRFLVGLGSGTLGLARGYVALTTTKSDRTRWMAYLTAAQFIGYAVTPGVGALLSFADIDIIGEDLEIDGYTGGGYIMAIMGIVNLLMMIFLWIEPPKVRKTVPTTATGVSINDEVTTPTATSMMQRFKATPKRAWLYFTSWVGMGILIYAILQFVSRSAVAVYETLSQLIAVNNFEWGVFMLGIVSCAFGVVGTVVLFSQRFVSKYLSDETILFAGLFSLGLGYAIFTPWGGLSETPTIMKLQYCIGSVFIFGIGFPITQALILSLFSKLLGPVQQSTIMGFMASLGSAARVLGAVVAGWAFQADETQPVLIVLVVCVFFPSFGMWAWHSLYTKRQRERTPLIPTEEFLLEDTMSSSVSLTEDDEERGKEEERLRSRR